MKMVFAVTMMLLISTQAAFSKTTDYFEKRFKFVRENGKLVSVIDNSISMKFGLRGYVDYIKQKIKDEQAIINGSFDYEGSVRALFAQEESLTRRDRDHVNYLVQSLKKLPNLDVDKIFSNPAFIDVLNKFEGRLTKVLSQIDPRVMASPQDPRFFYKKRATYQVLQWGLNYAKKKLSTVPLLNTAAYVLVEVEKMVRTRREFHQNMFLYYLHNFEESELGLTEQEANFIFSSIYESRIPWFAFWESKKAVANWNSYGARNFFSSVRRANNRLREFGRIYRTRGKRVAYSFQEVSLEGEDVIINLFDNEGILHATPAVAFSRTEPRKIARKRLLLQLGGLGISFLPVSQFIKDIVGTGLKSYYEKQMITEGALYGYFESMEEREDMRQLKAQYLNPFEMNL